MVQQELEKAGTPMEVREVMSMLMKVYKMRKDPAYKEKVLCIRSPEKSAKIRTFIRDTSLVLGDAVDLLASALSSAAGGPQKREFTRGRTRQVSFPIPSARRRTRLSVSLPDLHEIDERQDEPEHFDLRRHCRGKSCFCAACGGISYYHKFQKRINLFPLREPPRPKLRKLRYPPFVASVG